MVSRLKKMPEWSKRVLLVLFSTVFALFLVEIGFRIFLQKPDSPFSHNPIIQKQSDNTLHIFEPDRTLGHTLVGGNFVGVYEKRLISLADIQKDPRRIGKKVVLNIGDSSTSGWNSEIVRDNTQRHLNGQVLVSPFFSYPTYSDCLAKDSSLYVINAGVPGYTSIQGEIYLERLIDQFQAKGIQVDVVTIYFGNNECVWNGNVEDKYHVGNENRLYLRMMLDKVLSKYWLVDRVSVSLYKKKLTRIIEFCREKGIRPILIEPVVPQHWTPGLRADGLESETDSLIKALSGAKVSEYEDSAKYYYHLGTSALDAGDSATAAIYLMNAKEFDHIVPRIKNIYRVALEEVGGSTETPVVAVQREIPIEDVDYFIDYCHPIEPANSLIATLLNKIVYESKR